MKRRAFKLLLFAFAGAIINAAVAWSISLYGMPESLEIRLVHVSKKEALVLQRYSADGWPRETFVQYEAGGIGWMFIMANSSEQQIAQHGLDVTVIVVRSGWPLIAFEGERRRRTVSYRAKTSRTKTTFHNALGSTSFVNNRWDTELVPLKPLWPGFAINTIFYAAILFALFQFRGRCGEDFDTSAASVHHAGIRSGGAILAVTNVPNVASRSFLTRKRCVHEGSLSRCMWRRTWRAGPLVAQRRGPASHHRLEIPA